MTLKVVEQAQVDPHEDFLQKVILWYRNKRKKVKENYALSGNGHLGVTLEELQVPFERHFGQDVESIADVINRMLGKRTLVLFFRRYEMKAEKYYRWRQTVEAKILRKLPQREVNGTEVRFYLPDALGRPLKALWRKDAEVDRMIREIIHQTPASAA